MGSANSVNIARSEEENPSLNQRESSPIRRDEEESKTLTKDSVSIPTSKADDPPTNQGDSSVSSQDGDESKTLTEDSNETEEDNEGCSICTYIKRGECKESWIELEKCLDEAEKNDGESDVTKCKEARKMVKTCFYDNPVYYEPFIAGEAHLFAKMLSELQAVKEAILAEKAQVVDKMLSDLQAEKEAILAGDVATIVKALSNDVDILPAEAAAIAKRFSELEAEKKKEKDKEEKEAKESEGNQ